jgi:hypothetical protein
VQQDQPSVSGQTGICLEAIDWTSQRCPQGCSRRVGSRIATEAVRVQRWQRRHNHQGDWLRPFTCRAPITDRLPCREQDDQVYRADARQNP